MAKHDYHNVMAKHNFHNAMAKHNFHNTMVSLSRGEMSGGYSALGVKDPGISLSWGLKIRG